MSRTCELILQKKVLVGNHISHSNIKTKRVFQPNLSSCVLMSEKLGKINMRISTKAKRTIEKKGGLDHFLLETKNKYLTEKALSFKKKLKKIAKKEENNVQ